MNRQTSNQTAQPDREALFPACSALGLGQNLLSNKNAALNGERPVIFPSPHAGKQRVTISLPTPLIERLRNAVYWTGHRPLVSLVADAIEDIVAQMEEVNGGAFPQRVAPLKVGRRRGHRSPVRPTLAHPPTSGPPHR